MITLQEILHWSGGELLESKKYAKDTSRKIRALAELGAAQEGELAFFFSPKAKPQLMQSKASFVVTGPDFIEPLKASGLPLFQSAQWIVCKDPYLALAQISQGFAAHASCEMHTLHGGPFDAISAPEVHSQATVHPEARLSNGVKVMAHVVIESGATVGAGSVIYPGCYIGRGVVIGAECVLYPRVTLYENTKIGNRVRLHSGVVIGSDGFGYAPKLVNGKPVAHEKIVHFGGVSVGDDVEIGASTTVDRGTFSDTLIGNGVKIDNHCHLGHNTKVGDGAILCGFSALAGSAEMKAFSLLGGNSGLTNQAVVSAYAKIGGFSGVSGTVPEGEEWFGVPARPAREYFKYAAFLNGLFKDYLLKKNQKN